MKRTSSISSNSNANSSVIPSIDEGSVLLYAPHSEQHPQTVNDKGQIIRGTALACYMGYKHSSIDWTVYEGEEKHEKSVPKLALVFALKLANGTFKNTVVKVNYAVAPGSNLERALKAMGVTPEYETVQEDPEDELFGTIRTLDKEKLEADLEEIRGLAYLVEVENRFSKGKKYYNDIDLSTLTPRLNKEYKHIRMREVEDCDVSAVKIDFKD